MKELIKKHKKTLIFICILFFGIGVVSAETAATIFSSSEVSYSNEDMDATNVQDAIDELYEKVSANIVEENYYIRIMEGKYPWAQTMNLGDEFPTYAVTDYTELSSSVFFKVFPSTNNTVEKIEACYIYNNNLNCLSPNEYNESLEKTQKVFSSSLCTTSGTNFECNDSTARMKITISTTGTVTADASYTNTSGTTSHVNRVSVASDGSASLSSGTYTD